MTVGIALTRFILVAEEEIFQILFDRYIAPAHISECRMIDFSFRIMQCIEFLRTPPAFSRRHRRRRVSKGRFHISPANSQLANNAEDMSLRRVALLSKVGGGHAGTSIFFERRNRRASLA